MLDSDETTGGGQTVAPFPTNVKGALEDLLKTGDCADFIGKLLSQLSTNTGAPAQSGDVLELFDMISNMGGYLVGPLNVANHPGAAGTVEGTIVGGDATVLIAPIPEPAGTTEYGRLMNQWFYATTVLHETLHLARGQGTYSDRDLAEAAVSLGGLSQEDIDRFNGLNRNRSAPMSSFFDYVMGKHCPRP